MASKSSKKPTQKPSVQNIFLLSCLVLALTILVASITAKNFWIVTKPQEKLVLSEQTVQEERVIKPIKRQDASQPPQISAKAIYILDLDSQEVLYAKQEEEPMLPASTTKMATALVALNHYSLDQVIKVGQVNVEGQKMRLYPGEEITVENLLYGLLVASANDAAEVLAENYPGGRTEFIKAMNQLAKENKLENTHFVNPTGLDEYLHFSSAKDLVKLAHAAIQEPTFSRIVATNNYVATNIQGTAKHPMSNINELLGDVPGVLGVKTGWTENSGEDLVTLYDKDGHKIMFSVLGSQDRFGDTKALIEWISNSYTWEEINPHTIPQ